MGFSLEDKNNTGTLFTLTGTNGLFDAHVMMNTYEYDPSSFLTWPANTTGYTLYTGGVSANDDGYTNLPIPLPVAFTTNTQTSSNLYVSTNGYFTIGTGDSGIYGSPQSATPATMAANPGDNWLQPGLSNTDGDVQNVYYKTGTDGTGRYYAKLLVYGGTFGDPTNPTSWIANFYRDEQYHWLETRVKSTIRGSAGPYNSVNISQPASTVSAVWRGNLNGQGWVYMGNGTVVL